MSFRFILKLHKTNKWDRYALPHSKHSSDQMYCSLIYKNTSATCSELGVRKTYKEKLFQHPIHQEFTKSYNKLYGRIRCGKVPNDTPLLEQFDTIIKIVWMHGRKEKKYMYEYVKKSEYAPVRKELEEIIKRIHGCI